jgi:hypothetical protein
MQPNNIMHQIADARGLSFDTVRNAASRKFKTIVEIDAVIPIFWMPAFINTIIDELEKQEFVESISKQIGWQ